MGKIRKLNRVVKILLAIVLTITMMINTGFTCVKAADDKVSTKSSYVEYGEGYVVEHEHVIYNGKVVIIKKTTYNNNEAILEVIENGEKYTYQMNSDYDSLISSLTMDVSQGNNLGITRAGSLDYRYVTTMTGTEHLSPTYSSYSEVLGWVSMVLGLVSVPLSVASGIASIIIGKSGSTVEAWITTKRNFYGVYDSTGSFLGYYHVGYTVTTKAMVNGKKQQIDVKTGTYNSLGVY